MPENSRLDLIQRLRVNIQLVLSRVRQDNSLYPQLWHVL